MIYARNQLDPSSRFDRTPICERRTDRQTPLNPDPKTLTKKITGQLRLQEYIINLVSALTLDRVYNASGADVNCYSGR